MSIAPPAPPLAPRLQALSCARRPAWRPDRAALERLEQRDEAHVALPARPLRALRGLAASLATSAGRRIRTRDALLALVHRITPGFRLDEYERARALGYEAYLEEQLEPDAIDDAACEARLAGFTTLALSPKELVDTYVDDIGPPYLQLKGAVVVRAVHSRRLLYERMCEFWRDHFHVHHQKGDLEWALKPEDERTVIRPHALGRFPELLRASAFGPAMQYYLDNWLNVAGAPQENYARELMELHTLGLHGGYDEHDVKEVARCFTGWTLVTDSSSRDFLRTTWVGALHAGGTKRVLGQPIPAAPGRENAQRVLDLLAAHPSTARFLARKLCVWFLAPEPPEAVVQRVADAYLATGGDIRAMLRVVLARENLEPDGGVVQPKLRRPFHFLVTLLRTLEAEVEDPLLPLLLLFTMGHAPFEKVQPDGFPDTVAAWGGSPLVRWRAASWVLSSFGPEFGGSALPGVPIPFARLLERLEFRPGDVRGLARRIDARLLGEALDDFELARLQEFLEEAPLPGRLTRLLEGLTLAASMPGFQWY